MVEALDPRSTLAAAVAGDAEALGDLYRRYADVLYCVALRFMESEADARDVVQDVFVHLPAVLDQFDSRGSFQGWLTQITVRSCLMKLRRRRRRKETSFGFLGYPPISSEPNPIARIDVERALASLPEPLRIVVILKELGGFSHEEIAHLMHIEPGTSMVRLCRARSLLRRWGRSPHAYGATGVDPSRRH